MISACLVFPRIGGGVCSPPALDARVCVALPGSLSQFRLGGRAWSTRRSSRQACQTTHLSIRRRPPPIVLTALPSSSRPPSAARNADARRCLPASAPSVPRSGTRERSAVTLPMALSVAQIPAIASGRSITPALKSSRWTASPSSPVSAVPPAAPAPNSPLSTQPAESPPNAASSAAAVPKRSRRSGAPTPTPAPFASCLSLNSSTKSGLAPTRKPGAPRMPTSGMAFTPLALLASASVASLAAHRGPLLRNWNIAAPAEKSQPG